MTKEISESLSALMDGEAGGAERDAIWRELGEDLDRKALQTWRTYHLIRDALQTPNAELGLDVAALVHEALKREPTVLAPAVHRRFAARLVRPIIGAALAASVAAITVFALRQFTGPLPPVDFAQTRPTAIVGDRAASVVQGPRVTSSTDTDIQRRHEAYLLQHVARTSDSGIQGAMRPVRVVSIAE